ncbi:MAG: response regulator [Oscillospiraceae bacterium]|nr:response regulator [Oscillospiraceae bacterium]
MDNISEEKKQKKNSALIVDDVTSNIRTLSSMLQPDYSVRAAVNGQTAIEIAEKFLPDVILLDILMPGMDGYEVLSILKSSERTKDIPVIFITGLSGDTLEEKGLQLGAADYITKPFSPEIVKLRVRNQIKIINLQRDLEAAAEEARKANRSKSDFLANMSHEIRTPMNVIVGLTELLTEEDSVSGTARDYIKKINTAGIVLTGIINDVLDISKIESGKFTLNPVKYNTAELLSDIININIFRIEDKPVSFRIDIDGDLFRELYGDDLRIKQILNNLLSNAFKYTREGVVTLRISTRRKDGAQDIELYVSVSDTGIGIREEDIGKLFADYNQVDTQANRNVEGTGLGLSITKGIVGLMGGEISVESKYGEGTKFTVRLPQGFVCGEYVGAEETEQLRALRYDNSGKKDPGSLTRPDLSYARVLIVDDFPTNFDVAKGMLGKYKIDADCVTNGPEAIEIIKSGAPVYDAVFMDHMMPGMDGIETTRIIRGLDGDYARTLPIIALTANAVAGNEQMFLENGFQDFLSKPVSISKIDAALRKWIMKETHESESENFASDSDGLSVLGAADSGDIKIPGINENLGLSLYDGDTEMFIDIMLSFAENIPDELDKMREVSEDNLRDYAINAHTVKGSAASIGAQNLTEFARKMEFSAKDGDLPAILAENQDFINQTETLISDILAFLKQNGTI